MTPSLFAAALAAALAAPAPAEEDIKPPQGVPPIQVIARMDKGGRIEVTQQVMQARTEKRTKTSVVGGKAVAVEYEVTTIQAVPVKRLLPDKGVKAYTAAGKEIDARDLAEKLKKPAIAFLAWDGKKVDPFFLKPLKPDTLVIVPPPEEPRPADEGAKPPPELHKPKD